MLDTITGKELDESAGGVAACAAVEFVSVSKWGGAADQLDRRFVRNESLQTLIELSILARNVAGRSKGRAGDMRLEPLLEKINLSIMCGSVVGVVDIGGKSRTALLRILANSDVPSRGAVRLFGKMAAFQQLGAQSLPYLTCRENLEFTARLMAWPRTDVRKALERVPAFSDAGKHLDTPIRRVAKSVVGDLGVSLICCLDYDILIADDIDRPQSAAVKASWENYLKSAPELGKTVVLTGRNIQQLQERCTHLLLIRDAELLAYGASEEISGQHAAFLREAQATPLATSKNILLDDDGDEDDLV